MVLSLVPLCLITSQRRQGGDKDTSPKEHIAGRWVSLRLSLIPSFPTLGSSPHSPKSLAKSLSMPSELDTRSLCALVSSSLSLPLPLGNVPTASGFRQRLITFSSEPPSFSASYQPSALKRRAITKMSGLLKNASSTSECIYNLGEITFGLHFSVFLTVRGRGGGSNSSSFSQNSHEDKMSCSKLLTHRKHSTHRSWCIINSEQQRRISSHGRLYLRPNIT